MKEDSSLSSDVANQERASLDGVHLSFIGTVLWRRQ